MKTMHELLMAAPAAQTIRCGIAMMKTGAWALGCRSLDHR